MYKLEDLSSNPKNPCKRLGVVKLAVTPSSVFSERPCLKGIRGTVVE